MLVTLLLFPLLAHGEAVVIEPAGIQLERPSGTELIAKDVVTVKASNYCFPRIKLLEGSQIDCVMWRASPSLEDALNSYVIRSKEHKYIDERKFTEISRCKFKADSGIEELEYRFDLTRNGSWTTHLVRYIFRNRKDDTVCLGGFGDLDQINKLVMKSLAYHP